MAQANRKELILRPVDEDNAVLQCMVSFSLSQFVVTEPHSIHTIVSVKSMKTGQVLGTSDSSNPALGYPDGVNILIFTRPVDLDDSFEITVHDTMIVPTLLAQEVWKFGEQGSVDPKPPETTDTCCKELVDAIKSIKPVISVTSINSVNSANIANIPGFVRGVYRGNGFLV